jgi:hypothetical protein
MLNLFSKNPVKFMSRKPIVTLFWEREEYMYFRFQLFFYIFAIIFWIRRLVKVVKKRRLMMTLPIHIQSIHSVQYIHICSMLMHGWLRHPPRPSLTPVGDTCVGLRSQSRRGPRPVGYIWGRTIPAGCHFTGDHRLCATGALRGELSGRRLRLRRQRRRGPDPVQGA